MHMCGCWTLTFLCPQKFGHLAQLIGKPDEECSEQIEEPDGRYDVLCLFRAGDYTDYVFLLDDTYDYHLIFFMNIMTKRVEVVYNRLRGDRRVVVIHPFMMVCP